MMEKSYVTKREIVAFLLGMFVMLLIEMAFDWESFKKGFNEGAKKAEKGKVDKNY